MDYDSDGFLNEIDVIEYGYKMQLNFYIADEIHGKSWTRV